MTGLLLLVLTLLFTDGGIDVDVEHLLFPPVDVVVPGITVVIHYWYFDDVVVVGDVLLMPVPFPGGYC